MLAYPAALVVARPLLRIRKPAWWCIAQALAWLVSTALLITVLLPGLEMPGMRPVALWAWFSGDSDAQRALALSAIALFCWVRGVMLAGHRIDAQAVALGFQIGLAALIAVQAWAWAVDLALPGAVAANTAFVCAALSGAVACACGTARRGVFADPGPRPRALLRGPCRACTQSRHARGGCSISCWRHGAPCAMLSSRCSPCCPNPITRAWISRSLRARPCRRRRRARSRYSSRSHGLRMLFNIIFFGGIALLLVSILLANLRGLLAWLRRRPQRDPRYRAMTAPGEASVTRCVRPGTRYARFSQGPRALR